VGRWLAWKSFQLALAGALFGLAIGWLRWDAEYSSVLQRFSARIQWGIAEFAFSVLLMGGYAAWLSARPRTTAIGRWTRSFLSLMATTNLLYHFPPLFALIAQAVAGRIDRVTVDSATFRRLISEGEVLALTAHFALASVAVSGVALIAFAWRQQAGGQPAVGSTGGLTPPRSPGDDDSHLVAVWGGRIALGSSLLQIPVGVWLLLASPAASQQRLLGGDLAASALLVVSLVATLSLLHLLAAIACGDTSRRGLLRTIQVMAVVILMMSGVLQRLNQS
jgi:hypothetical protein